MDDAVSEFLRVHRTTARWLGDIITVLISFGGTAHVSKIAAELAKAYEGRDKNTVEEIVTRRINTFCSDAADFEEARYPDLFQKVDPATYRLRAYPARPDITELVRRVEFDEIAMQSMWDSFRKIMRQRYDKRWHDANIEKRLSAFVKWMARERVYAEYERRKAVLESVASESIDELFAEKK